MLGSTDTGKDIVTVSHLLAKHKNAENNLEDLAKRLDGMDEEGNALNQEGIPGRFIGFGYSVLLYILSRIYR